MAVKGIKGSVQQVMNTIRANASADYQERIPYATEDNVKEIGRALLNYEPQANEFVSALMNRIAYVVVKNRLWENPLREFKKGFLEFGDTIEELFVDIAKAYNYLPEPPVNNLGDVYKVHKPEILSRFHRLNRKQYYPVTINNTMLRQAFLSWNGVEDLIAKIIDSLYTGANFDEYLYMKQLVTNYVEDGKTYDIHVDAVTDQATAKKLSTQLRAISNKLTFLSNKYNYAGVYNATPKEDQVILISADLDAVVDVEVLADAFQLTKAEYLARRVIIDDFGDDETLAIVCDRDFFMIYDNFYQMTEEYNALHLYWNYFLHIWQILSTSEFANIIRLTTAVVTPEVTSVTVEPSTVDVMKGTTQSFRAIVEGTGNAAKTVTWTVAQASGTTAPATNTTIDANGVLTIDPNETNTSLTVKATSTVTTSVSGSATVTVTENIIAQSDNK